ncbi:MAG: hypothetical protein N2314_05740 [Brevinematales bacterium]|nr:hypothetical protein [Brevinematales bacterium]
MRKHIVFLCCLGLWLGASPARGTGEETNLFEGEVLFWRTPRQRSSLVITNQRIISNADVIAGITNWRFSNETVIFVFSDAFEDLVPFDPVEAWEKALAEMIFPSDWYLFPVETAYLRWQRRSLRKATLELIPERDLISFSPLVYDSLAQEKRKREGLAVKGETKPLAFRVEEWESEFVLSGWFVFRVGYGWVWKDPSFLQPVGGWKSGLDMAQNLRFHLMGRIGERVNVSLSHQSDNPENIYSLQYKALSNDKGVVREVLLGNVGMQIPQKSALISSEGIPSQGVGVLGRFQWGKLSWQSLFHLSGTQKGYRRFVGSKQYKTITIRDVHYLKRRVFLLPDTDIDIGSVEVLVQTNVASDRRIDGFFYKRLIFMQDYTLDHQRGELILSSSLNRDKRLVIRYTHGGNLFSNPAGVPWQGNDDTTGEAFLYLFREDEPTAPYMHYGVYALGSRGFDPGKGFDVRVVYTANPNIETPFQFDNSRYRVNPSAGYLWFFDRTPLPGPSSLYTNYTDPSESDSLYSLVCSYYEPVGSFQLDYNVIPGSESVFINGRKLSSWEYLIVSATGELILNQMSSLQDNDVIEVFYEYKPFYGAGVQRFSWANRWDYPLFSFWNIGGTFITTLAQRGEEGARLPQTPDGILLASVDNTFDMGNLLGWANQNKWTIQLEGAMSVYDPNTAGMAILEDFEGITESFQLSKSEYRWILCSPVTNIPTISLSNRAKLLYRDYREYKPDGSSSLIPYSSPPFAVYPYTSKPGPYMALGGHLPASEYPNVIQSVLVWDYDYSSGVWVGAVSPLASGLSVDLSPYDEIVFWAKIETDEDGNGTFEENTSHELEFFLAVGNLPEDSDGDGILDAETSSLDLGYPFHDPTNGSQVTRVGIGRGGKGDGFIQTEDLNANGLLDITGNWIILPSSGITSPTNLRIEGTGWREYRIRIDQLSSSQVRALQQATAVAIYLKQKNGTKGRVLIDGITFQKTKWQRLTLDGHNISPRNQWRTGILTTFSSAQYQKHRFYDPWAEDPDAKERYTTFENLHKMRSKAEALQYEEKSLSLTYSLSNIPFDPFSGEGGKEAMVWQTMTASLPLSTYEHLSFYIFVPSFTETGAPLKTALDTWNDEYLLFAIGSSTNALYQWSIPLRDIPKDTWHKVTLSLASLQLAIREYTYTPTKQGSPSLQDIKTIAYGIRVDGSESTSKGTLWINEIHVSNDRIDTGWATLATTTLDIRRPLWIWNGYEIFGPLLLVGKTEWRSDNFRSSLGVTNVTRSADLRLYSVDIQSSFFRVMDYRLYGSWLRQKTRTNEAELPLDQQFQFEKNNGGFTLRYKSSAWIPEVFHSYNEETQWRHFFVSSLGHTTLLQNGSTRWTLREKLPWNRIFSHQIDLAYEHAATLDLGFSQATKNLLSNRNHTFSRQKIFSLSLSQTTGPLVLLAGLSKTQQKYRAYTDIATLTEGATLFQEAGRSGERYVWIQQGLIEGFNWNDPFWQKDNESYLVGLQLDKPWPWIFSENKASWNRNREAFTYTASGNLLFFQTTHSLTNQWALNLYPRWFFLDTLGVSLQRQARLWYQSNQDPLLYQDIFLQTGRIYISPPWEYSTFWLVPARSNTLVFVSEYTNLTGSQHSLEEAWRWEWILPRYENLWDIFLPKRYRYQTTLTTSRVDFGYTQVFSHSFGTLSEFSWGRFWTNLSVYQINPLQLDLSLSWTENYLTRILTSGRSLTLRQTVFFLRDVSLTTSYAYQWNQEDRISNWYAFETNYGFPLRDSSLALKTTTKHTIGFLLTWNILDFKELNLLGWRINLRGSTLQNTENLSLSWGSTLYDRPLFAPFVEPIYEVSFEHSSRYQFTDYITGTLILKLLNHQYREVVVIAGERVEKPFERAWGVYAAFDLGIKF